MSERIISQVVNAPDYSEHCYLLLDGLAIDVPFTAYNLDQQPQLEPLFRGTRHASLIEATPWLLKPSIGSRLLSEPETWQAHGVLLHTQTDKHVLAEHMRSLLSIRLPSQQLAYCRFYNPEWASRLFSSMRPDEFDAWSGPISQWLTYSHNSWKSWTGNGTGHFKSADDEGWYALRTEQLEQWQSEEHQRFIDRAALQLGCMSNQPDFPQQRERVSHLAQQARDYGFDLEYQISHFLELAWRFPNELSSSYWTATLTDHALSADQRLQLVEQQLFNLNKGV